MKRHKIILLMLRNGELKFWTPVNFEVEYFLNEETEGVLSDIVIYNIYIYIYIYIYISMTST